MYMLAMKLTRYLGSVDLDVYGDAGVENAVLVGDGDVVILAVGIDNVASSLGGGVLEGALSTVDAVGRLALGPLEVLLSVQDVDIEFVAGLGATVSNEVLDGGTSTDIEALVDWQVNQSELGLRTGKRSEKSMRESSDR